MANYVAFQEARDYVENWLVRLGQPCDLEKKSLLRPKNTTFGESIIEKSPRIHLANP